MAICVQAQTEGVRKQGQSPEARTMKVHHSILLYRTDCYHFPLVRMYMCVWWSGLSIKLVSLCPWVSRWHGVHRTCRGLHLAYCVWWDLPHFRLSLYSDVMLCGGLEQNAVGGGHLM